MINAVPPTIAMSLILLAGLLVYLKIRDWERVEFFGLVFIVFTTLGTLPCVIDVYGSEKTLNSYIVLDCVLIAAAFMLVAVSDWPWTQTKVIVLIAALVSGALFGNIFTYRLDADWYLTLLLGLGFILGECELITRNLQPRKFVTP